MAAALVIAQTGTIRVATSIHCYNDDSKSRSKVTLSAAAASEQPLSLTVTVTATLTVTGATCSSHVSGSAGKPESRRLSR